MSTASGTASDGPPVRAHRRLFIGGAWVPPSSPDTVDVIEAHTGRVFGRVPAAGRPDVDRAVAAARRAFDHSGWQQAPVADRIDAVRRIVTEFTARFEEMARTISSENGSPITFSRLGQVGAPLDIMASMMDLAGGTAWEERRAGRHADFLLRREPVGVVGAIVAWNVPQVLIATKLVPALLAGCTVVVKAAPEASLDAMLLAEIVDAAGLPAGTVSVLTGGVDAGRSLVEHPGVDKIAFTGSTAAGREIAARCGSALKRASLELGGKSAAVILDDADLGVTARGLRYASFVNNSQACAAQTRILAPRSRYDEIVGMVASVGEGLAVGDPLDPDTRLGPLVSERQRDRVRGYIDLGAEEGAQLVSGGPAPPPGCTDGWFVRPTVFAGVDNRMRIAQEEIFGPVLVVIPYEDDADAVRLANDSSYGLAGSVWTADAGRGLEVARSVRTGTFGINGYAPDTLAPFGGYKESGIGREWGDAGLDEYVELKAINGIGS
ncbi:MAG: aldehyde dehydrogenase [Acidimicrobiales bacterium]